MTHVKWLRSIEAVAEPFRGWQQEVAYRLQQSEDDPGTPVTRMLPRALMVPPGVPEFLSRSRSVESGRCVLEGRAWSGAPPVVRVEVSADGGDTWSDAAVERAGAPFAWQGWRYDWDARPGEHVLCCRGTDAEGRTQPAEPEWNHHGYCNNVIQRISVTVP
jgi:hypothetical protein